MDLRSFGMTKTGSEQKGTKSVWVMFPDSTAQLGVGPGRMERNGRWINGKVMEVPNIGRGLHAAVETWK